MGSRDQGVNPRDEVANAGGELVKEICQREMPNGKKVEKWRLHMFLSSPMKLSVQVGKRRKKASQHVLPCAKTEKMINSCMYMMGD